ncbi:MAG: alpha/beta fold hydrolase, partial [Hymenobacteraceae bacterium]|nr:alpha/beta fold hydrolase [Hymenobacteraceae bacterium]
MTAPDLRPSLVLLHGALGAAAQFTSLAPLLVARFRVYTLDFAGHGPRPVSADNWRMDHFVDNLVALLDAENLGPARVFGYSMGGYAALVLAARQPARIHSVLTLGTKFEWDEA